MFLKPSEILDFARNDRSAGTDSGERMPLLVGASCGDELSFRQNSM